MTSLLRRVWVSAGPRIAVALPVFVIWSAYLVASGGWGAWMRDLGGLTGLMAVSLLLMLVVTVTTYRRSAATLDHRDALGRLASSTEEFCLILGPFGRDGRVVVPDARTNNLLGRWANPNLTLEQVVALAARTALNHPTYAIVDQASFLAPPGPTYLRVPEPEWQCVARRLIVRAHSIVLVLPPDPDMRAGFAWEVEQIVRAGVQHRVIIVLPPPDQDVHGHDAALQRASLLLAALGGSGRQDDVDPFTVYEYELQLSTSTVVLKCTRRRHVHAWSMRPAEVPQGGRRARVVVAATSYVPALAEAITDTERELRGLDFAVRYPEVRDV
jgi:hypothetical protein